MRRLLAASLLSLAILPGLALAQPAPPGAPPPGMPGMPGMGPDMPPPGPGRPITGDTPIHAERITGTARGAARSLTGTPYYRPSAPPIEPPANPVAALDAGFSVASPQRLAHLRGDRPNAGRITGSFAQGENKITGAAEFHFKARQPADASGPAPRERITGEGRSSGPAVTGDAWARHGRVTGVEGAFAVDRNPSLRAGKPGPFAGAAVFKAEASHEEPKQLVTGMFGFASKTSAKVTLSGGAQG